MNEWIKKHKKEVAIGTVGAVGAGLLYYKFGIKRPTNLEIENNKCLEVAKNFLKSDPIEKTIDIGIGTVTDYWKEGTYTNMILNDIKVSDLGLVGEKIIDTIEDITEDTDVTSVLGFINNISKED